jgi:hypothetical protein
MTWMTFLLRWSRIHVDAPQSKVSMISRKDGSVSDVGAFDKLYCTSYGSILFKSLPIGGLTSS